MQRLLAIAWLTWKAAFRFRLFIVVAVLLLVAVVGLPILIKDDGTARGFTQILLTYTLTTITGLLGLSTLWLALIPRPSTKDGRACHVDLVEALSSKDPVVAADAVRRHIALGLEQSMEALQPYFRLSATTDRPFRRRRRPTQASRGRQLESLASQ